MRQHRMNTADPVDDLSNTQVDHHTGKGAVDGGWVINLTVAERVIRRRRARS